MSHFARGATVICLFGLMGLGAAAQDKPKIWEGIYTDAQADRGKAVFDVRCAHCHGDDLVGGDGPSLIGASFIRSWASRYVDRLFKKVQTRMPADDPTLATDKEKLDIVTYLLRMNGFPAGKNELPLDTEYLSTIQIVGRNGPEPAPSGAMVEVMGCLAKVGDDYKLTSATDPAVSTMDDPEADERAAAKRPLGNATVSLLDVFPKPDADLGHKMLAKGLLIRVNDRVSLNVLHLGLVGAMCTP
jgi:quinoprotein glucose dehydrogenase